MIRSAVLSRASRTAGSRAENCQATAAAEETSMTGVQAEGDQRGGGGDRAGGDGDDRLDDVVAHGRGDEQADAAGELVAAGGACYWGYRGHRQQRPGACSSGHARSASTAMTAARRSSRAWPRRLSASS